VSSSFPFSSKDGLTLQYIVCQALYLLCFLVYISRKLPERKEGKSGAGTETADGSLAKIVCILSLVGTFVVHIGSSLVLPTLCGMPAFESRCLRYPDINLYLFAIWGFLHFFAAWLFVSYRQLKLPIRVLITKKNK